MQLCDSCHMPAGLWRLAQIHHRPPLPLHNQAWNKMHSMQRLKSSVRTTLSQVALDGTTGAIPAIALLQQASPRTQQLANGRARRAAAAGAPGHASFRVCGISAQSTYVHDYFGSWAACAPKTTMLLDPPQQRQGCS